MAPLLCRPLRAGGQDGGYNVLPKGPDPVLDAWDLQGLPGAVGGFPHAEPGGQHKGFIQGKGPQYLLGHQVPAAVAGYDDGV